MLKNLTFSQIALLLGVGGLIVCVLALAITSMVTGQSLPPWLIDLAKPLIAKYLKVEL